MPPFPAIRSASSLARSATIRAASASDSAPATTAAASSPWLCPSTAAGSTPCARHSAASDTATDQNTGCSTSVRSSDGVPWRRTSTTSQSRCGASAAAHSASRAANTGEASSSSAAIPAHWPPWPGKTKTTRPSFVAVTPWVTAIPSATARNPSRPSATARCSNAVRRVASDQPTSTGDSSGWSSTCDSRRRACARSAVAVRAESSQGAAASVASRGATGSAASSTTWALVPPMPNELTPAIRRSAAQPVRSATTWSFSSSRGIAGFGVAKFRLAGSVAWRAARSALSSPAMPAAPSRCPMFVLTEPTGSGSSRPAAKTAPSAAASIGSPTFVPVPCSST